MSQLDNSSHSVRLTVFQDGDVVFAEACSILDLGPKVQVWPHLTRLSSHLFAAPSTGHVGNYTPPTAACFFIKDTFVESRADVLWTDPPG